MKNIHISVISFIHEYYFVSISIPSNEVVQLNEEKNHTYTDTREKGEQLIFNSVELLFVCESKNP